MSGFFSTRTIATVALTGCLYAASSFAVGTAGVSMEEHPLAPPDRTSPRATLTSFVKHMELAHDAYLRRANPGTVSHAFQRAMGCLDLSGVAPTLHFDVGGYSALLLKEVLDRIELPPADEIPDAGQKVESWTIPRTEISIVRIAEGELAGEYLFSGRSAGRLQEFYDRAKARPYKSGSTHGLLDIYLSSPGGIVPMHWADRLPAWATARLFHRPLWKWLALVGYLALGTAAVLGVYRIGRGWNRRFGQDARYLRFGTLAVALGIVALSWGLDFYVDDVIGLRGEIEAVIKRGALVLAFSAALLGLFALFELLASLVVAAARKHENSADAHLIKVVVRILGIAVVLYVVVEASAYLGWAVAPVVAGLGIGGLAVALAARPTIENVIGGLILFADRPFRVGDFCRFGDALGTVEAVGLRSTRIRTLERGLLSVPNADLALMKIENLDLRDLRLLRTTLGLRCETTADQLRWVLAKLRELLVQHPMVTPQPARVRFIGYGAYSLDLEIFAYLRCRTEDDYKAIAEDLLLRIMDIIAESGTSFAFPSRVNYLVRAGVRDSGPRERREAEVARWRDEGRLPFPDFEDEERRRMEDTLDYPPRGSPHGEMGRRD